MNYYEEYQIRREREKAAALQRLREELLPALQTAGYQEARFLYSGSGDSGGIEFVELVLPQDVVVQDDEFLLNEGTDEEERVSLDDFTDDVYQILPGGFEINEGGGGTFVVDAAKGELRLEHYTNIMTECHVTHTYHPDGTETESEPTTVEGAS